MAMFGRYDPTVPTDPDSFGVSYFPNVWARRWGRD